MIHAALAAYRLARPATVRIVALPPDALTVLQRVLGV
jgi:hypothetical protein